MYNVTHMYLPNKRSSLLLLHSRIPLIECASEYSESLYSRIHIRIRHPVFVIRIVFVTWCIRSSPRGYNVSDTVAGSCQCDNLKECIAKNASGGTMRMNKP